VNQAHNLGDRPVTIAFDIPVSDAGYNAALGVWKISLSGSSLYDLREVYGQTIIDGTTQPGGRTTGPKIIVDGLGNHNNGFILRQNDNVVRGLAMQNFDNTHITISSDTNTIEDCWFGLSDNGTTLSSGSDTTPEGGSGISLSAGSDSNIIQKNKFVGFFGAAVAIRGDNNIFAGNWIGLRGDGTVPVPVQFDLHPCQSGAWTGGSGITVSDNNNQIGGPMASDGNFFAGLFLDAGPTTTQGPAMDVIGTGHVIQNNFIGVTPSSNTIGVCGRGLDFGGGPHDMVVKDNRIVEPALSAILMNGTSLNGNTLQGNIIKRVTSWPGTQPFNSFSENAIAYGPTVPAALREFTPATILEVNGTTISGISGTGSPCPLCTIEIFVDNCDSVTEALASLQIVTAAADGSWQVTLSSELQPGQCLRTMSTVPDDFTISGLDSGTTSNLSEKQGLAHVIYMPFVVRK
jgi:hypothetical protein